MWGEGIYCFQDNFGLTGDEVLDPQQVTVTRPWLSGHTPSPLVPRSVWPEHYTATGTGYLLNRVFQAEPSGQGSMPPAVCCQDRCWSCVQEKTTPNTRLNGSQHLAQTNALTQKIYAAVAGCTLTNGLGWRMQPAMMSLCTSQMGRACWSRRRGECQDWGGGVKVMTSLLR